MSLTSLGVWVRVAHRLMRQIRERPEKYIKNGSPGQCLPLKQNQISGKILTYAGL
jgi:hypothetical protein